MQDCGGTHAEMLRWKSNVVVYISFKLRNSLLERAIEWPKVPTVVLKIKKRVIE